MSEAKDPERNRITARIGRVAKVGANMSGAVAARVTGADQAALARALRKALGQSKGPLMKVAQLLSTIPDLLPEAYAEEFRKLQAHAPPMGWPFVQRRMRAELGENWETKFASFERDAAAAASLGQVHRAVAHDARALACKLQYPDMASAVEADLSQLKTLLNLFKSMDKTIDSTEAIEEVGERLREELQYDRELKHMRLFALMLADEPRIRTPEPLEELSSKRLLTMTWLEGRGLMHWLEEPQEVRNRIAELLFKAWWGPMTHYGVIHGDPHLGNYALTDNAERLHLLDFGCVRIFPSRFLEGVVGLWRGLKAEDMDQVAHSYEIWGFKNLNAELIDALTMWARFIYGPLLDDRVRTIADDVPPSMYGRREAFEVRKRLKTLGPVLIPREFVFMDRAAIGLGAAFLHLHAELNFGRMFAESVEGFTPDALAQRQAEALRQVGLA
ncbi:MAG TPA: AarF/ABC1/UbiB kinase family protein [Vitreimonas sp.]|uniref:ABC1 kinase family protein n=1 Tax=Vitreimonas sp. TaxID=3069702 RepID=UPI002D5D0407|nr:AarF/ABC1/UbiB kinase family protein [Vitreimonas sp.]HYD86700.1 AarF/ABC1/UbiB kinase family protein [Vitreimonas sp.]